MTTCPQCKGRGRDTDSATEVTQPCPLCNGSGAASEQHTEMSLLDWLEERRQNALRIANTKNSEERQGWLEYVSYFARACEATRRLVEASGDDHENLPLRTFIALKILRAWNSGTAGFDGEVVVRTNGWFDSGMKGPVPWPQSPFFAEWAEQNGFSKIGEYVGFKFTANLTPQQHTQESK